MVFFGGYMANLVGFFGAFVAIIMFATNALI